MPTARQAPHGSYGDSGSGRNQNALVALRQWHFRPGTRSGVAAPMDVEMEIGFTLGNDAIDARSPDDMVSLVGPGVIPPQAVRVVSLRSSRVGNAGTVVLDVVLLEDGTPRILRILQSLGAAADDMAVRAFEQWRFSPAQKDGRPIKVRMNAEVELPWLGLAARKSRRSTCIWIDAPS